MSTQSILKNIVIKNKNVSKRLVKALEKSQSTPNRVNESEITTKPYQEIKGSENVQSFLKNVKL